MCPRIIFANKGGKRLTNFQFGRFVLRKVQQFSPQHPGINLHLVISRYLVRCACAALSRSSSGNLRRCRTRKLLLRVQCRQAEYLEVSNFKTTRSSAFGRMKFHRFCISRKWCGTHRPRVTSNQLRLPRRHLPEFRIPQPQTPIQNIQGVCFVLSNMFYISTAVRTSPRNKFPARYLNQVYIFFFSINWNNQFTPSRNPLCTLNRISFSLSVIKFM